MTQTRTFLLFALMAVAYLLWMAWEKDYGPRPAQPQAPVAAASGTAPADAGVPGAAASAPAAAVPAGGSGAPAAPARLITLSTDVLRLTVDTRGGTVVRSELLHYPAEPRTRKNPAPPPVRLLDDEQAQYFVAQSGLVSSQGEAPDHRAVFLAAQGSYQLADGQDELKVDLTWQDAAGLKVTKTYTLKRGSYVVNLEQTVDNGGSAPWQGNAYTQLQRVQPPQLSGWFANFTNPSAHSFLGAAWYSPEDKFDSLPFADFKDPKKTLHRTVTGGWVAMLQHYFFAAWIPPAGEADSYATAVVNPDTAQPAYLIRAVGPALSVAPGQRATAAARLYVGPKLQGQLDAIAPGLELTTNYGWLTAIAQPLHWLLSKLHALCGNWGLAIVLLVLLLKAALWKLTAAQFRSGARMRKLQPRVQALRERYGDDKMKLQQAMMELYKKEKVNPMAGCLPILVTFPVFLGLYRVLMESVELRQAPFVGWIHDLSAPDPFFVLPAIYVLVMLATQWLTPTTGMDPTQAKMMKVMPLLFAVMFAFFPAGLVLYWVVNGATSLAQQWFITRQVEQAEHKAKTA
ncbi:membrane protein insertase YidC [Fulvimonas soli]|jgi:YidC/Oxa1 family membrane protein insertase|uniref:Membrane protein insertase YidC n=1 Tax=Fulvimonas soli TaxID=155197 RepID=A0A316IJ99_9GAMM|nr:membrane protein insertase YidC [Fulvimonas soli]PWK92534.1 protein translocase subunit yidC [Fulvimonas soli]TNY27745.1 membrane protein insertase YidC [Fulvimonas soli]